MAAGFPKEIGYAAAFSPHAAWVIAAGSGAGHSCRQRGRSVVGGDHRTITPPAHRQCAGGAPAPGAYLASEGATAGVGVPDQRGQQPPCAVVVGSLVVGRGAAASCSCVGVSGERRSEIRPRCRLMCGQSRNGLDNSWQEGKP